MESSILAKGKGLKQRKKRLLKDLNRVKKALTNYEKERKAK